MIATPPPCLLHLFFVSHVHHGMFGGGPPSFVSVLQATLHSYSFIAIVRLSILPVIPFALVYIIFSFSGVGCFSCFWCGFWGWKFLNCTFLGIWFVLVFMVFDFSMDLG